MLVEPLRPRDGGTALTFATQADAYRTARSLRAQRGASPRRSYRPFA